MCTVIVLRAPRGIVVAANRDELLSRPADGPAWRALGAGPSGATVELFAPLDRLAGGTWIAVDRQGRFAAVTNRFGVAPDRTRRSRGELVPRALAAPSLDLAAADLARITPGETNGFHLLVSDGERLLVVVYDGTTPAIHWSTNDVTIVSERSFAAGPTSRDGRIAAELAGGATDELALRELLARHAEPPLEGTCVHANALGYGTRSSTILALARRAEGANTVRWTYTDGPPCTAEWRLARPFAD